MMPPRHPRRYGAVLIIGVGMAGLASYGVQLYFADPAMEILLRGPGLVLPAACVAGIFYALLALWWGEITA